MELTEYQKNARTKLLETLKRIDSSKKVSHHGICIQLEELLVWTEEANLCLRMFLNEASKWPEHSGNRYYPVKSLVKHLSDSEYYYMRNDCGSTWKGKYGASRKRLLRFVIKELSKHD